MNRTGFYTAAGIVLCLGWAIGGEAVSIARAYGGNHLLEFVSGTSFLVGGVVAIALRPRNIIGSLLVAYGFLWFVPFWVSLGPPLVEAVLAAAALSADAILVHIAIAFPTGRAATALGRAVIAASYAWNVLSTFALEATVDRSRWVCDDVVCRSTLSQWLWPNEEFNSRLGLSTDLATAVILALMIVAVAQRHRLSSPLERRALVPLWIALAVVGSAYLAESLRAAIGVEHAWSDALFEYRTLTQMVVPIVVVYAFLRTRLSGSSMDQLTRMGARSESTSLSDELARVLRDPTLRLLIAQPDGSWRGPDGAPADLPIDDRTARSIDDGEGRPLAAIIHDPGVDPDALSATTAVVELLLENEALADRVSSQLVEVEASRARIVEAGDRERRRIERDLHDGAQQRLLSVALALRGARSDMAGGTDPTPAIDVAAQEVRRAITELRDLARGIHPSMLTESGLVAVTSLAERSAVPVGALELPDGRFRPAVETAAYFVVAEALTNVAKHAHATRVGVRVWADADRLRVEVSDDGVGGADVSGGGLRGIADRAAAVGGSLEVHSDAESGTRIVASFPLSDDAGEVRA